MIKRSVLLLGIAAICVAAQKSPSIPIEYQGSWSMDPALCNYEGDTLDQELYVTTETVGFHAEHHRIKSVKLQNGKLLLRYFKKKDAYREAPKMLTLSKNNQMLNDLWHKCADISQDQKAK